MNGQKPNQVQATIKVDLNEIESMKCACGNMLFVKMEQLKYISAFYTQTGREQAVELYHHVCTNPTCGIMYPGAMLQSEVKKFAKRPDVLRFDWAGFFMQGLNLLNEIRKAKQNA